MKAVLQTMAKESVKRPDRAALANLQKKLTDLKDAAPSKLKTIKGKAKDFASEIKTKELLNLFEIATFIEKKNYEKAALKGSARAHYHLANTATGISQEAHLWKGAKGGDAECLFELGKRLVEKHRVNPQWNLDNLKKAEEMLKEAKKFEWPKLRVQEIDKLLEQVNRKLSPT